MKLFGYFAWASFYLALIDYNVFLGLVSQRIPPWLIPVCLVFNIGFISMLFALLDIGEKREWFV